MNKITDFFSRGDKILNMEDILFLVYVYMYVSVFKKRKSSNYHI